jgi:hypothetical protein
LLEYCARETAPGITFLNESLGKTSVRPEGFEPSTLGSEDRLETIENRNILRGFDTFRI